MKRILYLTVVFFLIVSLNKAEAQNQKIDPYLIHLIVSAGTVNDKIVLGVKSERMYPTTGYEITYSVEMRKNELYIKFGTANAPEEGLTVFAPATCYIDLGKLEQGEYKITFEHNKKKTNGKLIVDSVLELTIDAGSNIKLK